MISKGSCDTEDWSNNAENSDLITGISYSYSYFTIFLFLLCFWWNKCSLGER